MSTVPSTNPKISATLSPWEQRVYLELAARQIVRTSEGAELLGKEKTARDIFSRLRLKGFAQRILRGVYLIVPPESLGREHVADPLVLASRIPRGEYFLSHHTALELHGIAHTVFSTVYVAVDRAHPRFTFQGTTYWFVSTKHLFGITKTIRSGQEVQFSDLERTVVDCVRRPDLAGGLEEILKSFASLPHLNGSRVLAHLERIGERSIYHRLGFILSIVGNRARIPKELIRDLRDRLSMRVYYLLPGQKGGRLVKKWRLIVPENVQELITGV